MGLTDLAAIRELAGGERPLFLAAHSAREIEQALAFTRETHMKVVLLGAEEGWMLAGTLAAAQVPVILDPFEDLPRNLDRRGSRLDNAAILDHAGVAVAFGTWSSTNARDLRQAAGIAVANGMPWASAWRAVTSQPARLYGVAARYGELSVGHEADLVVWDGDPFEPGTDVLNLYVGGHPVTIEDRQRALARKYHRNHL